MKKEKDTDKRTIFLSYCHADKDIADLLETRLIPLIQTDFRISRDIRDVSYKESFRRFMQSVRNHDYVIMLISDSYIKSLNCMYEVLETLKDTNYGKKILFIVLGEEDRKFYKSEPEYVAAEVYDTGAQGKYMIYWNKKMEQLYDVAEKVGDPLDAQPQYDEIRKITKIKLELPEFFRYLKDMRGLPFQEHLNTDFKQLRDILYR